MNFIAELNSLRIRVCQYRLLRTGVQEISTHLNAVDIVLALTDMAVKDHRPITHEEEQWFRAGMYLSYVFEGSEWQDIHVKFDEIVKAVERSNYFRKSV